MVASDLVTGPEIVTDPRMAGAVTRYHTWPTIKVRTVADHSWNVVRILLAIYPAASREMIIEAMLHDVGEVRAGDPPYPVKRDHPEYAKTHHVVETQAWSAMVIPWSLPAHRPNFGEFEVWVIKLADMLESWETGLEEMMLGNKLAGLVVSRSRDWLREELTPSGKTSRGGWRCEMVGQSWRWKYPWADVVSMSTGYMARRSSVWRIEND